MSAKLTALGGFLILLSAVPHAFFGWPSFALKLRNAGLADDVITGLSIGWYFGSVAMVSMGLTGTPLHVIERN